MAVSDVQTMEDVLARTVAPRRTQTAVMGLFAGMSLLLAGMAAGYAAGRAFESMLAGVRPADPATYGLALALAVAMTFSGTLVPTIRALRVDPVTALRAE